MEGNFIYEGSGDVIFAFYHGNESLTKMPGKDNAEGYSFYKGECDKGASIEWDEVKWAPKVLNLQETKTTCKLYFSTTYESICNNSNEESGVCYLAKRALDNESSMVYDYTKDNNLRFIGKNPNNYIKFNSELW